MPLVPPAIPISEMDARQQATFFAQAGIQAEQTVKTFTPTWFGYVTPPVGDISYMNFGKFVVMWITSPLTATSTTTDLGITNVPDEIDPVGLTAHCITLDNGNAYSSVARLGYVANEIEFELLEVIGSKVSANGSDYTNSGTKGLPAGFLIVYPLAP